MVTPKKKISLNFFENACTGSHMSPGQWRDPDDKTTGKDRLEYWLNLAKLAEKGKINFIFFADSYSLFDVYGGNTDAILRAGSHSASLDPMVIIPAMAAVTKTLGFGVTGSTSYLTPYILARTFTSLDHLTNGRVAWNVVTSWSKAAAKALGADDVVPHDERYAVAHEYMDLVYKFWESSWADDAVVFDRERRVAYEPSKVKKIDHQGKYLKASSPHQTHPSPQRTPVIFQAGTSKAGRAFGSKHAEAIYIGGLVPSQTAGSVAQIRADAAAQGRDSQSIKFFVGITPILGATMEEAQAKYERALENADPIGGLAQFSGFTGIDLSRFPLDEVLHLTDKPGDDATHTFLENFNKATGNKEPWTPRRLGQTMALGGFHPAPVGTPEMVADVFEQWIDEADVDGFNIAYVTSPGTFEDVVYLLRPELLKRGLVSDDYEVPGGSLRENLYGVKGQAKLRDDHYGHKFAWKKEQAEKEGKKNGVEVPVLNGST
ncbi:Nitrilotriacetate monooxygenase component A/pristinamycin IIA synthase subunit A [Trichodelitschia bisporula]|uniref:Nitrilotriacetate monooxygenase component A/pristinamycin IIA synthase subunit A n=1 Tax=Trichodelitschia bisporula TaxID=703511 RepID=A0A6G1HXC1_9PEZI|nr:Nitrilotriacetate monooxygenase component A/pristinamycin IIA synthase subunit A [Trichodelitschia bisporula]